MDPTLRSILIILSIGCPLAYGLLILLYKNTLMFRIGLVWLANLFLVAIGTRISASFPDIYPQWLSLTLIFIVSWLGIHITNKGVQNPICEIEEKLNLMSKGYLKFGLNMNDLKRKDEIGKLNKSIMNLSTELINVIASLKTVSEQIDISSQQLKSTSEELSSGASSEAASIEEISASMEEMVKSIVANSKNAALTNDVTTQAQKSVTESNELAHTAIEALERITERINMINDIALQTNILSLNAAVEAARSKENNSGFAVVATEVRKLADMSKNAAAEILKLSADASDISHNASQKLNETVPLISQTSELVLSIKNASNEQDLNANQINNAINEINGNIQSSAATAQEMAASAEELQRYARELEENISLFNTQKTVDVIRKKKVKKRSKIWRKFKKAA